jgi:hypothetical protein
VVLIGETLNKIQSSNRQLVCASFRDTTAIICVLTDTLVPHCGVGDGGDVVVVASVGFYGSIVFYTHPQLSG